MGIRVVARRVDRGDRHRRRRRARRGAHGGRHVRRRPRRHRHGRAAGGRASREAAGLRGRRQRRAARRRPPALPRPRRRLRRRRLRRELAPRARPARQHPARHARQQAGPHRRASNATGGDARFPGVIGTAVSKICRYEVARTGISEREAADAGIEVVSATIEDRTRAGYYPGAGPIWVKLVAEPGSGRLLGGQIVGVEGAAKRIDVLATAIWAQLAVDELALLDLSYAPPFSGVYDPLLDRRARDRQALGPSAAPSAAHDPRDLARAQEHEQRAAPPVEAHRRDAALLQVDARAGEVVQDLLEVGVVADEQHALVGGPRRARARSRRRRRSPCRAACATTSSQPQRLARQPQRVERADPRARDGELERELERAPARVPPRATAPRRAASGAARDPAARRAARPRRGAETRAARPWRGALALRRRRPRGAR